MSDNESDDRFTRGPDDEDDPDDAETETADDDWFESDDDVPLDASDEAWEEAFDDDAADGDTPPSGSGGDDGDSGDVTSSADDAGGPSEDGNPSADGTAAGGQDGDEGGDEDAGSIFDQDFGSAFDQADVPDGVGGGGGGGGGAPGFDDGAFGGGGADDDGAFGGGDGFGAGPDDFGGGGGFGGGFDDGGFESESFEDEDLDTDISRIELGIQGLDEMIQGGVPERSLMVAIGSAGTGKTTFGLQFLDHALSQGERAVYITLEESHDRIVDSATEKGMAFDEYVERGDLAVVDIDPIEMANSLASIQSELPRLVTEFGASRLVLDSVSLLEMMYDDQAKRRNEIYDFTDSLKEAGVTTMLTSEASEDSPFNSRHGIVEYLTDAVFILQYVRPSDFRETRLAIEIQKIRDANHSRETKPYDITNEGISVYRQANIF